jgi:oligoendopeptidase F
MPNTTVLPERSAVPVGETWDLKSVFATPQDWEAACRELLAQLPKLAGYQGRLKEGPSVLLEFIPLYEDAARLMGRIFVYASNASAVDSLDQAATGRSGQARGLFARFGAAVAFMNPELVAIGFDTLRQWMSKTPGLQFFAHYVGQIEKQQAHVRSGDVEQVLALVSDPLSAPQSVFNSLTGADMTFRPATDSAGDTLEVGQASIDSLRNHADRAVRRTAWESYADGYLGLKNTLASSLLGAVKADVFRMRTRGYSSSLEASLSPNFIPVEVFHNLIEVFRRNLPTWHRYWSLRRKVLGYDALHVYDIKAPLTGHKPAVPFEQAIDWICEGMKPLGKEYVGVLRRGCLEQRWVDRARNRGKREGAFSSGSQGTHPFIMMSYADDVFSLSTLAHELGHSMHSYYSRLSQRMIYSRYGLFAAEVASNFNQAMVRDHLFRSLTDEALQISLIEEAMSNYHRYFFIMPTLARFELEIHGRVERGEPVSADTLVGVTADLFREGYGEEVVFDRERIGITWAQFQHMYMNFYVYQYATGISGAHALVQGVLSDGEAAAGRYLEFLKSGGSRYPLDALKVAGVDLRSPKPVEAAFANLAALVDRLEALLGGIRSASSPCPRPASR